MKEKYCGECKWYFSCQKELCVSEYTPQQSVLDCLIREVNVPDENEDQNVLDENTGDFPW